MEMIVSRRCGPSAKETISAFPTENLEARHRDLPYGLTTNACQAESSRPGSFGGPCQGLPLDLPERAQLRPAFVAVPLARSRWPSWHSPSWPGQTGFDTDWPLQPKYHRGAGRWRRILSARLSGRRDDVRRKGIRTDAVAGDRDGRLFRALCWPEPCRRRPRTFTWSVSSEPTRHAAWRRRGKAGAQPDESGALLTAVRPSVIPGIFLPYPAEPPFSA